MKQKLHLFYLILMIFTFSIIQAQTRVDLSEKIIQIKNYHYNRFENTGFGFYDWSDGKYKIFNWKFEIEKFIPITLGEGPGEIKPRISNICTIKNLIFVNGYMEKSINIYNTNCKFIKTMAIDFIPKKINCYQDRLYIFNAMFFEAKGSPVFVKIVDPLSFKTIKDIYLKDKIVNVKEIEGDFELNHMLFRYDINKKGNIYLLDIVGCTLFEIDENGKLIKKTKLPHHFNMKTRSVREGTNVYINLAMDDLYLGLLPVKESVYFNYRKTISKDIEKGDTVQTYIIKLNGDGEISQKNFDGDLVILGEHEGYLYLFDFADYIVTQVKLSDWD